MKTAIGTLKKYNRALTMLKSVRHRLILFIWLLPVIVCQSACENRQVIAPDFRLESLEHERFYLHSYRGYCVLLIFGQVYCTQCVAELLAIKDLVKEYREKNKKIISVYILRDPENKDIAGEKYTGLDITMPILLDYEQTVTGKYGINNVPSTVIINHDGFIIFKQEGYTPALFKQIKNKLEMVLEEIR
ncbi:MAG: redoxin domain-containing protein [Spirochaetales bacterium]|nr:redoxin domain-containing protein [Spirochaetales bacterium]